MSGAIVQCQLLKALRFNNTTLQLINADFNNVPKPLIEGISYPATPRWNIERPFLTGQVFHQVITLIVCLDTCVDVCLKSG